MTRRAGDVNLLIGTVKTEQIRALTCPARQSHSLSPRHLGVNPVGDGHNA